MKTSFWAPYISDHTIQAICWTLIHSLWIGVVIALMAGAVITLTRKSKAELRYRLLCGVLVLFVASVGITFYTQVKTAAPMPLPGNIKTIMIVDSHGGAITNVSPARVNFYEGFVSLIKQNTDLIFMIWQLLFLFKSFKMAGGLLYIRRIRSYKVHEVPEEFKHKIEVFARQIGISHTVRLMQSELVKIPVAVGWLKPVILLPLGIILQLPAGQIDSILWHELAHVRRRDYLVNILQGLVETVFFFNPGLLWLSSLIRAEREACCDDIVLSRMNRKANYLEALLAFGSEDNSRLSLAMGIGAGNQLRDRMKRMISQENKRLSATEKVVLVVGLIVLSAFTGLPKTTKQAVQQLVNVMIKKPAPAPTYKTTAIDSDKKEPIAPHKIKVPVIDTPRVKADTAVHFTSVLFKQSDADLANNDISAEDANGKKYHFVVADDKLMAMDIDGVKISESDLPKYQYMLTQIDRTVAEKRRVRLDGWTDARAMSPAVKFKMDGADRKMYFKDSLKAKFYNGGPKLKLQSDMKLYTKPIALKRGTMLKRWQGDSLRYSAQRTRVNHLIADLVKDKIATDAASVKWFGLSNTEFIVNGQKQPDDVQQRYKNKYGVHEDDGLYYGPVAMTGKGEFIDLIPPGDKASRTKFGQLNVQDMKPIADDKELFKAQQFKQRQLFAADGEFKMQPFKKLAVASRFSEPRIPLQDIVANIADDLVKDNIVKDKNDLRSFNLTNTALIVNGKTQSAEAHQKLKDKYLQEGQYPFDKQATENPNFGLHYNPKTGSMGLGIMDNDKD